MKTKKFMIKIFTTKNLIFNNVYKIIKKRVSHTESRAVKGK